MIRLRVVVRGRVQGVWFRGSTGEAARAAGVAGWVRNRADGSVEAVFEGERTAVERLVTFCREGPPQARVDAVQTAEETPEGLSGFEVR
jgi:acylphosphatase